MNWLKKIATNRTVIGVLLVACALAGTWYFQRPVAPPGAVSFPAPVWPTFQQSNEATPQVVVQVEPDFGYRTGDVIPVNIFVRQNPGTEVDIASLALEGDFEIRGEPVLSTKSLDDGAKGYCLQVQLQSFRIQPKLGSAISFTWNSKGERQWKEMKAPLVDVFTSLTWDGERKEIQPGSTAFVTSNHMYVSIGMLAGSVLLFVGCLVFLRYYERLNAASEERRQASPRLVCKRRVDAARKLIEAGDDSKENFRTVAEALRTYLGIETVEVSMIPAALGDSPYRKRAQASVNLCERVVYRTEDVKLNAGEMKYLWQFIDDILLRREPQAEQDRDFILNRPRPLPAKRSN